jgi:hypothetical protein
MVVWGAVVSALPPQPASNSVIMSKLGINPIFIFFLFRLTMI